MQYLENPGGLVSFVEFKMLLNQWLEISSAGTVGDLKGRSSNPKTLISFVVDGIKFRMHADTKREAIVRLMTELETGEPTTVVTKRQSLVLGTTNSNDAIKGLYIYRD